MEREAELRSGLAALELKLSDAQVGQLLQFAELLLKWNKVYNLTALRSPQEALTHHVLDSATVLPGLSRMTEDGASRILDVGSGGGLPGVVIAIARPDLQVESVDAVAKKVTNNQQLGATLHLPNLRGVHSRVEQIREPYDIVASRAFASLGDFVSWSRGALAPDGVWMAMKGKYPADEIQDLPPDVEVFHVEQLQVPGLIAERCLLWLRRRAA